MNYYVIKNMDEVLFVIMSEKVLYGGRRLCPTFITKAQYETYIEFGIPVKRPGEVLRLYPQMPDDAAILGEKVI